MTNPYIIDRGLPQRSKLRYYFPNSKGSHYVITLPFFENPVIKENKKGRFKKYTTIGRSSNLYSYHGADSRQFSVNFNLTIPHIIDDNRNAYHFFDKHYDFKYSDKKGKKDKFLSPTKKNPDLLFTVPDKLTKNYLSLDDVVESQEQLINKNPWASNKYIKDGKRVNPDTGFYFQDKIGGFLDKPLFGSDPPPEPEERSRKSIHLEVITYYVNLIRTGVINNAENPLMGPPILRLIHGPLYLDIPCICTDYSINFNEAAGYDIDTLMPNQIQVSLKLEEFRTGNFERFDLYSSNPVLRDNLAGWESVIGEPNSMDPRGSYRTSEFI